MNPTIKSKIEALVRELDYNLATRARAMFGQMSGMPIAGYTEDVRAALTHLVRAVLTKAVRALPVPDSGTGTPMGPGFHYVEGRKRYRDEAIQALRELGEVTEPK